MNLELFPCSGGMAEGFRRAGITFDLAIDKDPDAADSYATNLGHPPALMDVKDFARLVELLHSIVHVDLLVADPPCTPWSKAGKRLGTADTRDCLVVTCDLIRRLRPERWILANVPGLDEVPAWPHAQRHIGGLSASGYCIDFARFDAADYGVPQHRVRPFWFGHRNHTPCIRWPDRTHGSPEECQHPSLPGVAGLRPWVTCKDALGHLPEDKLGRFVRLRPIKGHPPARPDGVAPTIRGGGDGHSAPQVIMLATNQKHPINVGDSPSHTVTAKGAGRGVQGGAAMSWPYSRPAPTVCGDPRLSSLGDHAIPGNSQRGGPTAVILSEVAAAILQGFPESWKFCGRMKKARWSQIGQAMPPPLAEVVARAVVEQAVKSSDVNEAIKAAARLA